MNGTSIKIISCRSNSKPDTDNMSTCPKCGGIGTLVKNITLRHLVVDGLIEEVGELDYFLCTSKDCDVVYYNKDLGTHFNKNDIKVPIWLKQDANPKYACYCSKVTEEQVISAVVNDNATNIKEVLAITGAMANPSCETKNPLGKCCHHIIQDVIDKAMRANNRL
jgi:bacterioferritin-associated ferredoxin